MSRYESVEFEDVTTERTTPKALLLKIDGKTCWIPRSQIHDDSEVYDEHNCEGKLVIPQWLAEENGLV